MKTKGIELKLSKEKSEEFFYDALCNGLDYLSGYGLSIKYSEVDYKYAKIVLEMKFIRNSKGHEKPSPSSICYEDVLMQILKNGKSLKLIDNECDGEYNSTIKLKDVHERVQKTPINHLIEYINETGGDATTADVVLQTVFYNDIIFG